LAHDFSCVQILVSRQPPIRRHTQGAAQNRRGELKLEKDPQRAEFFALPVYWRNWKKKAGSGAVGIELPQAINDFPFGSAGP
jgi:hypothetical protein